MYRLTIFISNHIKLIIAIYQHKNVYKRLIIIPTKFAFNYYISTRILLNLKTMIISSKYEK